jgi:hypothetical protein
MKRKFTLNITKQHKKAIHTDIYDSKKKYETQSKPCSHQPRYDFDTGDCVCTRCHEIYDKIMITENYKCKNSDILIWDRLYDKSRWIKETIEYLKGEHNMRFCDLFWYEMVCEIPNPFTWKDVYQVFHNYKLTDYWLCFSSYIGIQFPNDKEVIQKTIYYSYLGYTKYSISFLYLMYKFTQMKSESESVCIPFKSSYVWMKKTDEWWKTVCKEHNWVYHDSKVHSITWEKQHIEDSLHRIVEEK